jgi:hypothetical protein
MPMLNCLPDDEAHSSTFLCRASELTGDMYPDLCCARLSFLSRSLSLSLSTLDPHYYGS